jgi:hypothetical protein
MGMTLELIASLYGQVFSSATVTEVAGGGVTIQSAPGRYVAWIRPLDSDGVLVLAHCAPVHVREPG